MKKALLLALTSLLCLAAVAQSGQLGTRYPQSTLLNLLAPIGEFAPVPTAADSYWQSSLPQSMRQSYITDARNVGHPDWSQIPDNLFALYTSTGDRASYESVWLKRHTNMTKLVMGEIMEHQGNFISEIVNGLNYLKNQVWWGSPAHYTYDGTTLSQPQRDVQVVDLYGAEAANQVAWTLYMLGDELNAASPGIVDTMKSEVQRRLLVPGLSSRPYWMRTTSNHNSWIGENWLSCILLCETDRNREASGVEKILCNLDSFATKYSPDGGCDEGAQYWNYAGGSLFECYNLLYRATNGAIDLRNDETLKRLSHYIIDMHISGNYFVNIGDCPPYMSPDYNMIYNFGQFIGDDELSQMGAYLARLLGFNTSPAQAFRNGRPSISRELMFLTLYDSFRKQNNDDPAGSDSWYPYIQVMTAQSPTGGDGLFVAAKGGNNNELHNHNDVGNIVIYYKGTPMIMDIGDATYTAATFSADERYDLLNTRSAYHNVPLINGYEQHDGAEYKATNVRHFKRGGLTTFSQNLAATYPAEAGVTSWVRTLQFDGSTVRVTENYVLSKYTEAPCINYLLAQAPLISASGRVTLRSNGGTCYLTYDTARVSARSETVSIDGLGAAALWGKALYRLTLTPKSTATSNVVEYTLRPAVSSGAAAQSISLDRHAVTLGYDSLATCLHANLTPASAKAALTWTSSNEAVAIVGTDGTVTGLNSGNAVITCTTASGLSDSCVVRVPDGIASIDIEGDTYVDGANAAVNFGSAINMSAKRGSSENEQAAYMIFALRNNLPAGITTQSDVQIKLVLYLLDAGSETQGVSWNVYPLAGIRWKEATLTHNTARNVRPTLTNLLASIAERPASDTLLNNRLEFDVTTYTKSQLSKARVAYYLTQSINNGGDGSDFCTREHPDPTVHPRLVIKLNDVVDAIRTVRTQAAPETVNVYTVDGVLLRRGVKAQTATEGLPHGLYIVGGRKVIVR